MRDQLSSEMLRRHFKDRHDIAVGLYSYGCFDAARIGRGTRIGRYCSIAPTAYILRRNHNMGAITMHPFLYNEVFGFPVRIDIPFNPCVVEDDVWIGHQAIVLPSVANVGRGAVIAAGAVVTKDVAPYAVVAGNPARELRTRFPADVIARIEATRWWEMSRAELLRFCETHRDAVFEPRRLP